MTVLIRKLPLKRLCLNLATVWSKKKITALKNAASEGNIRLLKLKAQTEQSDRSKAHDSAL